MKKFSRFIGYLLAVIIIMGLGAAAYHAAIPYVGSDTYMTFRQALADSWKQGKWKFQPVFEMMKNHKEQYDADVALLQKIHSAEILPIQANEFAVLQKAATFTSTTGEVCTHRADSVGDIVRVKVSPLSKDSYITNLNDELHPDFLFPRVRYVAVIVKGSFCTPIFTSMQEIFPAQITFPTVPTSLTKTTLTKLTPKKAKK